MSVTNNTINQIGVLPFFLADNLADQTNVTGDGTTYTVKFTNILKNTTSSFDGTSTFTAPLTGRYHFTSGIFASLTAAMTTTQLVIVATSGAYYLSYENDATQLVSSYFNMLGSVQVPMNKGDIATVQITVSGSTKTATIKGLTAIGTLSPYFSGYMIPGI